MSILVVGSVALDTVKSPWGQAHEAPGGSALYFALAASLFAPVQLVGVVGDDFPRPEITFLQKRGIDTAGLEIIPGGRTFRWTGEYENDVNKRHTLDLQLNVFKDFHPHLPALYRQTEYIFLANIDPALQAEVLKQVKAPQLVVCDTMNIWIETKRAELERLLRRVDMVILNDSEALMLAQETNLSKAARYIKSLGPRVVVIKKGEHGVLMLTKDFFCLPAFPLASVCDPTGAGDSFAGGFMGWLRKAPKINETVLRQAVLYGSITASFTVESFGLERLKKITRNDIKKRGAGFRKLTTF